MADTPVSHEITFRLNGREERCRVEPRLLLGDLLRDTFSLTGLHFGCEEGACGACTVTLDGRVVKSCLVFAVQADGAAIETIESLNGGQDGELHPLQRAFSREFALQCGFCTPGMILAARALLEDNDDPSDDDIRRGLAGNLCRCTGYQNILHAVKRAAREKKS